MAKYQIIYADPPWSYFNGGVPQGGVNAQYQTMSLGDIMGLRVNDISADTSVLLLWATFPQLREALEVMSAWGFEYKTLGFSWIKTNKNGTPFFGIGYYAKSNAEVCLLGVKGKAHSLVKSNKVSSVILHPKTTHSTKPAIVREKIVELFGDLPRIELFAREKVEGWDAIGNDIDGMDIRDSILRVAEL
jgi:N6-adenosine-specific RNA methylase IME4